MEIGGEEVPVLRGGGVEDEEEGGFKGGEVREEPVEIVGEGGEEGGLQG